MERKVIENHYYKDAGDGATFMSGLPLPRDPDGIVRNIEFRRCEFHPCCAAKFENCKLVGCDWENDKEGNFELK